MKRLTVLLAIPKQVDRGVQRAQAVHERLPFLGINGGGSMSLHLLEMSIGISRRPSVSWRCKGTDFL